MKTRPCSSSQPGKFSPAFSTTNCGAGAGPRSKAVKSFRSAECLYIYIYIYISIGIPTINPTSIIKGILPVVIFPG